MVWHFIAKRMGAKTIEATPIYLFDASPTQLRTIGLWRSHSIRQIARILTDEVHTLSPFG